MAAVEHERTPFRTKVTSSRGSDLEPFLEARWRESSQNLYAESLAFMERFILTSVLARTGGNQSVAATTLGITRGSLRNKMKRLGISVEKAITAQAREPIEVSESLWDRL